MATPWPPIHLVVGVHDDVGAMRDRVAEIGRGEGAVDHQRQAGGMRDLRDARDVEHLAAGIADRLAEDQPRGGRDLLGERIGIARIDEGRGDAEARQGQPHHVAAAAIDRGRGDDVAALPHQGGDRDVQRRLAARHRERADAAFEGCDAFLEHRHGGIGDAAVDMAADLEVEQAGGVLDIAEDIGGRLVDRHGARAGHRIGPLARMQRECVKLEEIGVGHEALPGGAATTVAA